MTVKIAIIAGLLLASISYALTTLAAPPQAEPDTVQLWAITNGDQHKVELRWIPEEGWLPPGGYNLYRIQGEVATKVNDRPIVPDARVLAEDLELKSMMSAAAARLSPSGQAQVRAMISGSKTKTVSAVAEFREARTGAVAAMAEKSGQVTGRIKTRIVQSPKVKQMAAKRVAPARRAEGGLRVKSAVPAISGDERIQDARDSLRMASLFSSKTARDLGMAYTDDKVVAGQTYYYELRAISSSGESPLIRTRVTVGKDAPLSKPIVETPLQLGQTEVGLHFAAESLQDSAEHGLLRYNVYRLDGKRILLNGDKPILQSYAPTTDGKLQEHLLTFTDSAAPARKSFSYEVEVTDIFGRTASTVVPCTMEDLAEPLEQPVPLGVGPLDRGLTTVKTKSDYSITVYWVPVRHTTEDNAASIAVEGRGEGRKNFERFVYTLERADSEASPSVPVVISGSQPIDGTPVTDLSELTVEAIFQLFPGTETAAKSSMKSKTNPNGFTEDMPASELLNRTKHPALPAWQFNVVKFVDSGAGADRYYSYRLTPALFRNGRSGVPQLSGQVGVPAKVFPGSPTAVEQSNVLAPTTAAEFQSLKAKGSMTNVSRLQPGPGRLNPQGVAIKTAAEPAKLTPQLKAGGSNTATLGGKGVVQKKAAVVGVPTNYGRVVTIKWQAPQYTSPVYYRVYRAVATGYRTTSGESTSLGFRASGAKKVTEAGPIKNREVASVAPRAPQNEVVNPVQAGPGKVATGVTQRPPLKRSATLIGNSAKFMAEFTPGPDDYTLLGSTQNGETAFTDLVPRSQAMTYYYVVEPVNRWGQAGARSAPLKALLDPSLNPSVPIVDEVSATADGQIRLNMATNLEEEKVTRYEVYRLEVPMPVKVVPNPDPSRPVGPKFAGKLTLKEKATLDAKKVNVQNTGTPVATKSLQKGLFAEKQTSLGTKLAPNKELDLSSYTLLTTLPQSAATGGTLIFPDTTVEGGKAYVYRVIAVNVADLKSDATLPYDGIPVKVVADPPTLTAGSSPFVDATYTVSFTINRPTSGATSYLVERSSDGGQTWKDLGARQSAGQTTIIADTPVRSGQTYIYRVSTVDFAGNVSTPVTVTVNT